jgi:hypothetical protein
MRKCCHYFPAKITRLVSVFSYLTLKRKKEDNKTGTFFMRVLIHPSKNQAQHCGVKTAASTGEKKKSVGWDMKVTGEKAFLFFLSLSLYRHLLHDYRSDRRQKTLLPHHNLLLLENLFS